MISAIAETSEASIDEVKFQLLIFLSYEILRKNENFGQKRIF